jgi:hypothetical protein
MLQGRRGGCVAGVMVMGSRRWWAREGASQVREQAWALSWMWVSGEGVGVHVGTGMGMGGWVREWARVVGMCGQCGDRRGRGWLGEGAERGGGS